MNVKSVAVALAVLTCASAVAQEVQDSPARPSKITSNAQTAGFIAKSTGSGTTVDDSILFQHASLARIGVNTNDPKNTFHVFGGATSDVFMGIGPDPSATGPAMNFGYSGASNGRGSGFFNVRPDASAVAPNPSLRFMTINVVRMIITNTGNVGIGTLAPAFNLDVVGTGHFTGALTVDGNIAAKYQDVAEWVPATTDLAPATVVVLNPERSNEVMASETAYDTRVAGVVSVQPGVILGEQGPSKEQIATTGRVKVRVDARKNPIRVGDLLVTSDTPGLAMRSEPLEIRGRAFHQPGTIIGKALESLDGGTGEILVLLSMQ